jgi:hypothetical protein|tara:strand:- start:2755 stop:3090 length:336 start_codon:yes stop_codon:yes gene_type:complete
VKEAQISREITKFLRDTMGLAVWSTEQGFRKERGGTRISPGVPDLIVMGKGVWAFVEVKTPKGKMRDSQLFFQKECKENGVPYLVWRDVRDAFDWLVAEGVISQAGRGLNQ